ncbi:MAG: hypothetical protein O8C62_01150 [Candidatus Methanoperedens sp.]|nr:hypothetical protein [Candidatus Methanoperedens sp.]
MSGELKKKMLWDGIIIRPPIRPPICYLPPMWEVILNRDIGELAKNLVATVPDTAPAVIEKHLNERIKIVEKLKGTKKLDGKIADMAISHFKAHLEELKALRM